MRKDELNGDHSFKMWFKIMYENGYILRFAVAFVFFVIELIRINWCIDTVTENFMDESYFGAIASIIMMLIPPAICIVIGYLGFYKFWKQLVNQEI